MNDEETREVGNEVPETQPEKDSYETLEARVSDLEDVREMLKEEIEEADKRYQDLRDEFINYKNQAESTISGLDHLTKLLKARLGYWKQACIDAMTAHVNVSATMDVEKTDKEKKK